MSVNLKTAIFIMIVINIINIVNMPIMGGSIGIANYIKSKYLGITVSYQYITEDVAAEIQEAEAEVNGIVLTDQRYMVELSNGDRAVVVFTVNTSGSFIEQASRRQSDIDLQRQVLKTQEIINAGLRSIGDTDGLSGQSSNSILAEYDQLTAASQTMIDADNAEEIIYIDAQTNYKKKGNATATLDGIFLSGKIPVEISFVVNENEGNE